jgi:hypothetical protein
LRHHHPGGPSSSRPPAALGQRGSTLERLRARATHGHSVGPQKHGRTKYRFSGWTSSPFLGAGTGRAFQGCRERGPRPRASPCARSASRASSSRGPSPKNPRRSHRIAGCHRTDLQFDRRRPRPHAFRVHLINTGEAKTPRPKRGGHPRSEHRRPTGSKPRSTVDEAACRSERIGVCSRRDL